MYDDLRIYIRTAADTPQQHPFLYRKLTETKDGVLVYHVFKAPSLKCVHLLAFAAGRVSHTFRGKTISAVTNS